MSNFCPHCNDCSIDASRVRRMEELKRQEKSDLDPELQRYAIPTDTGSFKHGLQVGFPKLRLNGTEVFKERLNHAQYHVPGLRPSSLFIDL